jgi:hypothetical protein
VAVVAVVEWSMLLGVDEAELRVAVVVPDKREVAAIQY